MKILVISDLYPPFCKGGHEIRCKIIADSFVQKGHEVDVLTCFYGTVNGDDPKIHRKLMPLTSLETKKAPGRNQIVSLLRYGLFGVANYFIALFFALKIKPDIVYAGQLSGISVYPIRAFTLLKIPVVHHAGNYHLVELIDRCVNEPKKYKRNIRKIVHGFFGLSKSIDFSHIITVSNFVKKAYLNAGVPVENLRVIAPRGVALEDVVDESSVRKKTFKPFRLLYVGRIVERKGLKTAILAVDNLINERQISDIIFDIIGDGDFDYHEHMKSLVEEMNIGEKVCFRGKMTNQEVVKEYSKYNVLLVPSIWNDPNPSVVIEAMSQGVAVIASSVGGIPDRIENEKSGILVGPGDHVALVSAILTLIEDPAKLESICIEGIKKVKNEFLNDYIVNKILDYMFEIKNMPTIQPYSRRDMS